MLSDTVVGAGFVVGSRAERYPCRRLQLAEELCGLGSVQKQEALGGLGGWRRALKRLDRAEDASRRSNAAFIITACHAVCVCPVWRFLVWETSSD